MIQLIAGLNVVHSAISKTNFGIQEVIYDESRPRGHQLHTVLCQNKVQTYQFDENISNWGV